MDKIIHLSLAKKGVPVFMDIVQSATAPGIQFILDDYTPPSGSTARLYIKKGSAEVYNNCAISGNKVSYTPTAGSFDVPGDCVAQLQVLKGSAVAVSYRIFVRVEPNLITGSSAPASTEFDALTELIQSASQYDGDISTLKTNVTNLQAKDVQIDESIADIKGYIGYTDSDIYGLEVDFKNKTFSRLAGAVGLTQGANFDNLLPWKLRRCNLADNGTVNAYYGDSGFKEDGSNGQVMVEIPAFYYKMVPLTLEPQTDGIGYHVRKARWYVSGSPKEGLRLHPAFYDANGNPVPKIYIAAYEGCLYDTSASAYIKDDSQVADFNADKMASISGAKPISGMTQNLTRANANKLCTNRGTGWYSMNVKTASAIQLLMMIEAGTMNTQTAYGKGVVDYASGTGNEASNTGSTSSLGNSSGSATSTTHVASDGTTTTDTAVGKLAVSYRGIENPYGNIWKFAEGINVYGNGSMKGGVPYICTDKNYTPDKRTDNYESADFTATNTGGYINAIGYGNPDYDWLIIASEVGGNTSLPVGDYQYVTSNLNGFRMALLGGGWRNGWRAGAFFWALRDGSGGRFRYFGGRAEYIPLSPM